MRKKVVLIGAGSAVFTQGLVADLALRAEKEGTSWHLALVDVEPEILSSMTKLVKKMLQLKNADIELSSSADRRDVLAGADFVVSTIGVGGRRAWEQDVFIPRKYGIYQPVGDTAMPGGISRAMRMIAAMTDIVKDVMTLCPDAFFINYSNPMTAICRAVRKSTGFPIIGLCGGTSGMEYYIAEVAGLDMRKVTAYSAGINHLTFVYDFRYEGRDAWPIVREKIEEIFPRDFDQNSLDRFHIDKPGRAAEIGEPYAWSFFKAYGAFPAPGDRHICEFFADRFPGGRYFGKTLGVDAYSFEGCIEHGDKAHANIVRLGNSPEPLPQDFFGDVHGEGGQFIQVVDSVINDRRKIFYVNVPNNGAVPNLPRDAVLEIPAAATAKGFLPLQLNDFPDVLAGIIARFLPIIEVTVEAALKGDRKLFAEAILMGGYISDRIAVEKMVDELIKAQKQYLPQFIS